jgi:hypothetical protein
MFKYIRNAVSLLRQPQLTVDAARLQWYSDAIAKMALECAEVKALVLHRREETERAMRDKTSAELRHTEGMADKGPQSKACREQPSDQSFQWEMWLRLERMWIEAGMYESTLAMLREPPSVHPTWTKARRAFCAVYRATRRTILRRR